MFVVENEMHGAFDSILNYLPTRLTQYKTYRIAHLPTYTFRVNKCPSFTMLVLVQ